MDLHLSDKIAIVTGASKGIGLSITQALVDGGPYVVAGSRSRGPISGRWRNRGKVTFVSADLSRPTAPMNCGGRRGSRRHRRAREQRRRGHGASRRLRDCYRRRVGTVVGPQCDGDRAAYRGRPATDVPPWRRIYRHRRTRQCVFPDPGIGDHCATKAAVIIFGKALSKELGPKNIVSTPSAPDL